MSVALDTDTRNRLERLRAGIAREFVHIPESEVDARFDEIVSQLAGEAAFGDFVPILAWRYTRERLHGRQAPTDGPTAAGSS